MFRRPIARRVRHVAALACFVVGAGLCGAVEAQSGDGGPSWADLNPAQRNALGPLKDNWSALPAESRQKWIDVAGRFPAMSPEGRDRVQARMSEWSRMSADDRGRARLNFQESRQLSPEERQARWQAYQALPPERRRELGEQAAPPPRDDRGRFGSDRTIPPPPRSVAPGSVQAQAGASTTLLSRRAEPPAHQQAPGAPRIAATPEYVDRSTLLPQRGPQGAGMNRMPGGRQKKSARP